MNSKRIAKVNDTVRNILSDLISQEIKDPRINLVSILKVDVSADLKNAKIYFSVIGGEDDKEKALEGLTSAKGFLRGELGKNVKLKYIPELHFILDSSIEEGIKISNIIDEVIRKDESE